MSVLVDTPIWSLALRRKRRHLSQPDQKLVEEWAELVRAGQAQIIGPIRQEILSGIRRTADLNELREVLSSFEDIPLSTGDYEQAAIFFNQCRAKGITGTPIDLQICAIAHRLGFKIFTTDADFVRYARHIPIQIYL